MIAVAYGSRSTDPCMPINAVFVFALLILNVPTAHEHDEPANRYCSRRKICAALHCGWQSASSALAHLIMLLPSSSLLGFVLLLMPATHSVTCHGSMSQASTMACILCCYMYLLLSRVHSYNAALVCSCGPLRCVRAICCCRSVFSRELGYTIQQGGVQLWEQDVPCVASPVELRRQGQFTGDLAGLQVSLCEEAQRDRRGAA